MHQETKKKIIGSDNGWSPGLCQAIIWTIAGILLIGPLGTNFSEILYLYIFLQENAFENVVWKVAAILSRPQPNINGAGIGVHIKLEDKLIQVLISYGLICFWETSNILVLSIIC